MNLDELENAAPPAPAQAKSPRGEVVTDPQQLKAWRDAGALPPRGLRTVVAFPLALDASWSCTDPESGVTFVDFRALKNGVDIFTLPANYAGETGEASLRGATDKCYADLWSLSVDGLMGGGKQLEEGTLACNLYLL